MPAITLPSAETPEATLWNTPPGRSPRPTIPPPAVQRNASGPEAPSLPPTTTLPSAETAFAKLSTAPPARSPTPLNQGWFCASAGAARASATAHAPTSCPTWWGDTSGSVPSA